MSDRLDDRRYVAVGTRAYVVGTQAGRFPAMGFHTRGEMGGVWAPPLKLLDGLWFSIDGEWVGPGDAVPQWLRLCRDGPARHGGARGPADDSCPTGAAAR